MYTLIRTLPRRQLVLEQVPTLSAAFLIAEIFYKFHSFALECGAFLATWFVLDMVVTTVRGTMASRVLERGADSPDRRRSE